MLVFMIAAGGSLDAVEEMTALCLQWEEEFSDNHYSGRTPGADLLVVGATYRPDVAVTAPHAVNHTRAGAMKLADRGTGGLALALATTLGAWGVAVASGDPGDASWDDHHPLHESLLHFDPKPKWLLDIHGMGGKQTSTDVEIGTADVDPQDTPLALRLADVAADLGLSVGINERFDASRPTTLTARSRSWGFGAVQVEFAPWLRLPVASEENLRIASFLLLTAVSPVSPQ